MVRLFLAASVLAALAPLAQVHGPAMPALEPAWPSSFEGRPLKRLELAKGESEFLEGSGLKAARFSDGEREVILREILEPSRKVHSAMECMRASGYSIHPLPLFEDAQGLRWQSFEASKGLQRLRVREIIQGPGGPWSDPSSWYWSTLFSKDPGPWHMASVANKLRGKP